MDQDKLPFLPADILLPRDCEYSKWSVVACDQYTSQPEYWHRVEERVGSAPSTLRLVLPESRLEGPDTQSDIMEINSAMSRYLREDRFQVHPNAVFYIERTLDSGKIRRGLVGRIDLEQYDYEPGSAAPIRATEGTVLSRIPPRVAVRKNAPIELPHVMLLADDPDKTVIEPLADQTEDMTLLYDFDLMEGGGRLRGWELTQAQKEQVAQALAALADPAAFRARYHLKQDLPVLLFAVGDGNHSLATAKECYERQKRLTPPEHWDTLPARFALVELNNLHDTALEFEPIHRVIFGVEPQQLLAAMEAYYPGLIHGEGEGHVLPYVWGEHQGTITVPNPKTQLPVATLQRFLDDYLQNNPGRVDYIHGAQVARDLARRKDTIAFLLPAMGKEELFPTVIHDGVLPRKTFSMGRAQDKRFYLEARRIRD